MFPSRYYPDRYFAPRYFAKVGEDPVPGVPGQATNGIRVTVGVGVGFILLLSTILRISP